MAALFAGAAPAEMEQDLDVATLSLDELLSVEVTTPGKVPERIRDTPASVRLISRTEIEQEGYATLTEVFESVPGFYNVNNYSGGGGNFGIRGFWNGRSQNSSVAVLVNGVPHGRIDNLSHPLEMLAIPMEAVDRIEIVRGPNSVIYGNGASFGAINIITDESYFDDQVAVAFGGRETRRGAGRASAFGEDWHVVANAGYFVTGGLEPRYAELMTPETLPSLAEYNIEDLEAGFDEQLEEETRFAQVAGAWKWSRFEVSTNDAAVEFMPGGPPLGEGSLRESESRRVTVGAAGSEGDWAVDAWVSFSDHQIDITYDAYFPDFVGYNNLNYSAWEAEGLLTYAPSDDTSWLLGANWQDMRDMDEITHIPLLGVNNEAVIIDSLQIQSLFSQYSGALGERWRVVAGARVEQRKEFDRAGYANIETDEEPTFGGRYDDVVNVTPRVSLIYQPTEADVLKIMAGEATKLPNVPFSEDFESETTRTFEINYTRATAQSLWGISLFRNTLDALLIDELRFLPNGTVDTATVPGGKVETLGVELLSRAELDERWKGELSLTYQESEDKRQPDLAVSYSPELVAHAKIVYAKDGFSTALLGRYVSEMKSYFDVAANDGAGAYIGQPVDGYAVFDANVRWEDLFFEGFFVSLRITNLLDTEFRYPNNPINTALFDRGLLGGRRRALLTAGYKW